MSGDFSRFQFPTSGLYQTILMQQGRVALDADWNNLQSGQQQHLQQQLVDLVGAAAGPKDAAGFALTPGSNAGLQIGAGRYYVAGILCSCDAAVAWARQPYLPVGSRLPLKAGSYIAYLDVWPRIVNAWQDPALGEVALGGADTAVGLQQVWQLKLLPKADPPPWSAPASPVMTAQVTNSSGLGNWLYRVEVHYGSGTANAANGTFKWSRRNGAVTFGIQAWNDGAVTLAPAAAPLGTQLAVGDWVEFVDDDIVFGQTAVPLWQVAAIDAARNTVTLSSATGKAPAIHPDRHPMLQRWDQQDGAGLVDGTIPIVPGSWLPLEDGITVQFPAAATQPAVAYGDFWTFTARAATGGIDWPADAKGVPLPQPKQGISHNYAQIAALSLSGTAWTVDQDLRVLFGPLAGPGGNGLLEKLAQLEKRLAAAEKQFMGR
ncbi:DUF6519 domain-containing protein [Ferrovibrio xuzhouensis]|uniref:DUF6519 domain-containing protein n=1 Tax=Ferrovibrio xuzhouensis TaxID=1576914 RepID=A0ABV7VKY5_9PROT